MPKRNTKSYSKFTFEDLQTLGLQTVVVDIFEHLTIAPVQPSAWLIETLARGSEFSLNTEKAKSEFIIAPILNELYQNNKKVFAVYSGFNFNVDPKKGLQGFCDFLLARLPLNVIPNTPIIAIVEAKLNDAISAAVPQCSAEMYATRIWNEKRGENLQTIYGAVTTGDNWLFLRLKEGMTIEVDKHNYSLLQLEKLLGTWQHIINQYN
ncbi:MAG: hypothetical protein H7A23_02090 [Leptospiraceae bacterium]|nr:hypothetical protein [Leptospiraceae bacterium]MCP5493320.1 hypothetical protein [Leptospiraceae bacterium]